MTRFDVSLACSKCSGMFLTRWQQWHWGGWVAGPSERKHRSWRWAHLAPWAQVLDSQLPTLRSPSLQQPPLPLSHFCNWLRTKSSVCGMSHTCRGAPSSLRVFLYLRLIHCVREGSRLPQWHCRSYFLVIQMRRKEGRRVIIRVGESEL